MIYLKLSFDPKTTKKIIHNIPFQHLTLLICYVPTITLFWNVFSAIWNVVKLHSNLQTQLNFSWFESELTLFSHGRRWRKEGRNNPHLAFSRRNDPTCLIFGDCLLGVWRVYGNCLKGVWRVSGRCPLAVWRVS